MLAAAAVYAAAMVTALASKDRQNSSICHRSTQRLSI